MKSATRGTTCAHLDELVARGNVDRSDGEYRLVAESDAEDGVRADRADRRS